MKLYFNIKYILVNGEFWYSIYRYTLYHVILFEGHKFIIINFSDLDNKIIN